MELEYYLKVWIAFWYNNLYKSNLDKKIMNERKKLHDEQRLLELRNGVESMKINAHMNKVRFFPGSKVEYESMVGYEVEIIDTGLRDAGIRYKNRDYGENLSEEVGLTCYSPLHVQRELMDRGIEALVNCDETRAGVFSEFLTIYGLPVARKK